MPSSAVDRWNTQLRQQGSVLLHGSRAKASVGAVGCFLVVVVVLWGVILMSVGGSSSPKALIAGCLVIAIFGFAGMRYVRRLVTGRPRIRVDPGGITVNGEHLAWSEIEEIRVRYLGKGGKGQVVVDMTEQAQASRRQNQNSDPNILARLLGDRNWILQNLKDVKPKELAAWLTDVHVGYRSETS